MGDLERNLARVYAYLSIRQWLHVLELDALLAGSEREIMMCEWPYGIGEEMGFIMGWGSTWRQTVGHSCQHNLECLPIYILVFLKKLRGGLQGVLLHRANPLPLPLSQGVHQRCQEPPPPPPPRVSSFGRIRGNA